MPFKDYFDRNWRWLSPLLSGLMLAAAAAMMPVFDPGLGARLAWLQVVGLVMGGFGAGFGVVITDTLSARLLASVAFLGVLVACAHSFLGLATVPGGALIAVAVAFVVLALFRGRPA